MVRDADQPGPELSRAFLITGGAGFIGAAIVRALLERGDRVVVLDSGVAAGFGYVEATAAQVVRAELEDRRTVDALLADCDAVVHLAARTSVPASVDEPLADFKVNVTGSLGLLEAARISSVRRIVFASSSSVTAGHGPPAREDLVPSPLAPYGAAKAAIEFYLRAYQRAYEQEGVSLRFANAYGPRAAHKTSVIAAFVKAYLRGGPLIIRGDGHQTRDFVHVDDVTRAVVACLDAPAAVVAGEVFQIGTGTETSLRELVALLFEVGGAEVPVKFEPPSAGDARRNVSDVSKARRDLGYEPQVSLRDGLARTLEWFRDNWSG